MKRPGPVNASQYGMRRKAPRTKDDIRRELSVIEASLASPVLEGREWALRRVELEQRAEHLRRELMR